MGGRLRLESVATLVWNTHASLDVRGVLWILDELEHQKILSPAELFTALTAMLKAGARLPEDECDKRLARWRAG
jgi:hypothetical protein